MGAVAAFLICFEQITNPVSKLANLWTELQASLAQGKRLFEVIDLPEEDASRECNQEDSHKEMPMNNNQAISGLYPITFENVGFHYGNHQVLTNVNLTIEPGKVTAFAGPSGSGKSTLLQLILATYEPNEGVIQSGKLPLSSIPLGLGVIIWLMFLKSLICSLELYMKILHGEDLTQPMKKLLKQQKVRGYMNLL